MKPIDPINIKSAVKAGQLYTFVKNGNIYIRDTDTNETVKIGEVGEHKGHWVEVYDLDYLSYLYSCDQCGEHAPTKRETMCDQILTGYCPNCGARMVG